MDQVYSWCGCSGCDHGRVQLLPDTRTKEVFPDEKEQSCDTRWPPWKNDYSHFDYNHCNVSFVCISVRASGFLIGTFTGQQRKTQGTIPDVPMRNKPVTGIKLFFQRCFILCY